MLAMVCATNKLSAAEESSSWKCFKASDLRLEISPASLSPLEVEMKDSAMPSTISLYAFKAGVEIPATSKELNAALVDSLKANPKEGLERGPFIGDATNFVLKEEKTDRCYLVSRETRIDRLLIVPLIDLGNALLQTGPGKMIVGDCHLMVLSKGWLEGNMKPRTNRAPARSHAGRRGRKQFLTE